MGSGNIDVIAAILQLSVNGSSKKALQGKTGLTHALLEKHLALLESKNLIKILPAEHGSGESVKITERGTKFLDLYDAIHAKYLSVSPSK